MRPIALGRKNWLHTGSEAAGHHVAAVASAVESCKRGGICVGEYLESVLSGLNRMLAGEGGSLTPHAWQKLHRSAERSGILSEGKGDGVGGAHVGTLAHLQSLR